MPHTIIDIHKPLKIPAGHLVWGLVTDEKDLESNSMSLKAFAKIDTRFSKGDMIFEGSGAEFVTAFKERIHHILEANGAFFNGHSNKGHAQRNQNISFNTIQPYPWEKRKGCIRPSLFDHKIYLKNVSKACRLVSGWGGHPGIKRSTGMRLSSPSVISGLPLKGPPVRVQLPTAMTTLGSGTAS